VAVVRFDSSGRTEACRFAIFNHKGGVGKTTLTMNIGASLAQRGRRVLLVDSDPQCNLTSYLVEADVVDDLLDNSDTAKGQTVWSAVRPVSEALGGVTIIEPIELTIDGLFLVPGDIRLSEFEGDLNDFWGQCLQRKPRGFRGTTAISDLVNQLTADLEIDYVLYDSGPNIGPLNRAILLDCDQFIVPVACDLFSLRALKTLGRTLVDWITSWQTIADLAPAEMSLLPGTPMFLGYVPEGFRTYGGTVTRQQSYFLSQIDKEIFSQVVALLRTLDPGLVSKRKNLKLGEVKDFGQLVPASQREGTPLYDVSVGSAEQRALARDALTQIATQIDEAWQGLAR
jgi:cellulose biosynthesis protein BcsQ